MYNFEHHLDDESLELYAFGRLSEPRAETLEEHLLICDSCRVRLDKTEEFQRAMARGTLLLREHDRRNPAAWLLNWFRPGSRNPGWLSMPSAAWAAAALAVCAVLWFSTSNGRFGAQSSQPLAIWIQAQRGGPESVPANRPLHLRLDARGLNLKSPVHVLLVSAAGVIVKEETAPPSGSIDLPVATPLHPGTYYARITKTGSTDPAREFAINAN